MPNASRHLRRHRAVAATTPGQVTVTTEMVVSTDRPMLASVGWKTLTDGSANPSESEGGPSCCLEEDGTLRVWIYVGDGDDSALEGGTCTPDELSALARALVALADRVQREHAVARRRLREWRERFDEALEPLDVCPAGSTSGADAA